MTILDGKKLSEEILSDLAMRVKTIKKKLSLAVIVATEDQSVRKFIEHKKRAAHNVGIAVRIFPFPSTVGANELRRKLSTIVHNPKHTGVIIQLPLPLHIPTQHVLNSVTPQKDVDVLSARAVGDFVTGKSRIVPPVVASIEALLSAYSIDVAGKHIVIVGEGPLVGRPTALWLLREHATFSIINEHTPNSKSLLKQADIIISGVGRPGIITGDVVKDGVVAIDAGTSESEGRLVGDIDFASVSQRASYVTPVPGGIGPLTIAMLLKNVVTLAEK